MLGRLQTLCQYLFIYSIPIIHIFVSTYGDEVSESSNRME